jgi:hypothetical protein
MLTTSKKNATRRTDAHDGALGPADREDDLEQFVLFAYPWGKANTPLCNMQGPRTWQRDDLAGDHGAH